MTTDTMTLEEAWAAAEAALGEYWRIRSLIELKGRWEVVATDGHRILVRRGATPLEAIKGFLS